jgi:lactoylglutathione lyase
MIKGLAHTAYTVSDMEKSLCFYCDVLGLKKAFELNRPDGKPWIIYLKVSEGQFIELFYGEKNKTDSSSEISYSHLCFEVDDIYDIANRIKSKGVVLDSEPNQGSDTNWQCWVKDPDGNRIEMMQMNPLSPQMNA